MPDAWKPLDLSDPAVAAEWDQNLLACPDPTIFHSSAWAKTVFDAYHAKANAWQLDADGVRAQLVSHQVRKLPWGRKRISAAYAAYGGIISTGPLSRQLPALPTLGHGQRISVRTVTMAPADPATLCSADKVTMWLELPETADPLWKSFPPKVRNQVRKAEKEGVTCAIGRQELIPEFHQLYARRMHELGTPAHAPVFFESLLRNFPEAEILLAHHDGVPIGTVFDIGWGRWRVNLFGSTLFAKRHLCPNNLIYWKSLERGVTTGKRVFDFGRSAFDSGQYDFKKQWGATPHAVANGMLLNEQGLLVERPVPGNESSVLRGAAWGWRKLPLDLANRLSPFFRVLLP